MKSIRPQFFCPWCGRSQWGTSGANGPKAEWIGHCNTAGCSFMWPRDDDHKYFSFIFTPSSREEFDELETQRLELG